MKNELSVRAAFRYPEISTFYETPFHTLPACFEQLLTLPRAELIADLELLLRHETALMWQNDSDENDNGDGVFHCLLLLAHLKSEHSLPVILETFRVPGEKSDALLGDLINEDTWFVPLLCGLNQADKLVAFIQDVEVTDEYSKAMVFDSLEQMAVKFPEKKNEVMDHIYDLLKFFNELSDEALEDYEVEFLLASIADAVAHLSITRALPIVKALFKKDRIDPTLRGDWHEFKKELHEEPDTQLALYEDIRDWYKMRGEVWRKMAENRKLLQAQMELEASIIAQEKERIAELKILQEKQLALTGSTKIGRNDPCPCGSGKKFKRCHGE